MKRPGWIKDLSRLAGDYLTYSRGEQRGILVLALILAALVTANLVFPSGTRLPEPEAVAFEAEALAFELAWQKAADSDSVARQSRYRNAYPAKPAVMVELNSADTLDLQQLRGIGPGFARRITGYRDRIGGFHDKRQVLEVFGMDTARYRAIAGQITVDPTLIKPFDANKVTIKELLRHPYFPFPIAKGIIVYRQKHKGIKTLEALRDADAMSDSLFRRMVPYLRVVP